MATGCLDERWTHDGERSLRYYRDEYYTFNGCCYRRVGVNDVDATLIPYIKSEFDRLAELGITTPAGHVLKFTSKLLTDVRKVIQSLVKVDDDLELPAWLVTADTDELPIAANLVATPDGLVDLEGFISGSHHLIPATPRLFTVNGLDFSVDQTSECPEWLRFLDSLWPDDRQSIELLQEWFGYVLTNDTSLQKMLMILGPKRSGKSTIGRVLHRLVGESNVVSPTLRSLQGDFGLWPLIGKTLAIIGDARLSARVDGTSLLEVILGITGEDMQTVNRKQMSMLTLKLPTRFMINVNEFPRFRDASDAFISRLLLLQLRRSWIDQEDTTLSVRLTGELPGILSWSLEGLRRLRERGRFIQPDSARELLDDCRRLVNPVQSFIEERLEIGHDYRVPPQMLWMAWESWRENNGIRELSDRNTFGRALHSAIPMIRRSQTTRDGRRERDYIGIRLREARHGTAPMTGAPASVD